MTYSGQTKAVSLLLIIAAVVAAPHAEAAITCSQVLSSASPCLGYIRQGGAVPPSCCDGIKSLFAAAATTQDLRTACGCIKSLATGLGAKAEFINSIPGKCSISIPYRYSPSMDCSKLH